MKLWIHMGFFALFFMLKAAYNLPGFVAALRTGPGGWGQVSDHLPMLLPLGAVALLGWRREDAKPASGAAPWGCRHLWALAAGPGIGILGLPLWAWCSPATFRSWLEPGCLAWTQAHPAVGVWGVDWARFGVLVTVGSVVSPLVEEAYYRAKLLPDLRSVCGPRVAWLASSALFALAHWQPGQAWSFSMFIYHCGFGMAYGYLYLRGGLGAAIVGHSLHNTLLLARGLAVRLSAPL